MWSTTQKTAITFIITLVFTTMFNFLDEYWLQLKGKGTVTTGPTIVLPTGSYYTIDITNYGDDLLNDLRISIPAEVKANDVVASHPINISEVKESQGTTLSHRVEVSSIEGSHTTRLLIPIQSPDKESLYSVLNAEALNLKLRSFESVANPISIVFRDAVISALIYSLVLSTFSYVLFAKFETMRNRIEKLEKRFSDVEKRNARTRVILMRRLSDYSTELDFWRNTMRHLLTEWGIGGRRAQTVFLEQVTKALKTFGTLGGKDIDITMIEEMAVLLKELDDASSVSTEGQKQRLEKEDTGGEVKS